MTTTRRVEKPWGYELIWAHTERYVGKLLHVKQGHKLSLQYHNKKDETIHVQSGKLLFVVDEGQGLIEKEMNPGESYHIKPLMKHRMVALTDGNYCHVPADTLLQGQKAVNVSGLYDPAAYRAKLMRVEDMPMFLY